MDIANMRSDFSLQLTKLDQLNNELVQHISDLQDQLNQEKKKHEIATEKLLKNQKHLLKAAEDNQNHQKQVRKYKDKLRRFHDLTKTKELEWIKYTKDLKSFYLNCKCQSKNTSLLLPTQIGEEEGESQLTKTESCLVSPTQESAVSTTITENHDTTPTEKHDTILSPCHTRKPSTRPVSKLKRIRKPAAQPTKRKCPSPIKGATEETKRRSRSATSGSTPEPSKPSILYAEDSQEPNSVCDNSTGDLSFEKAVAPETPSQNSEVWGSASPVLNLLELSHEDGALLEVQNSPGSNAQNGDETTMIGGSPMTPIRANEPRKPKKFNILTECRTDGTISEELLGFSLPGCSKDESSDTEGEIGTETGKSDLTPATSEVECPVNKERPPDMPPVSAAGGQAPGNKHLKVVRRKEERAKLAATSCPSCYRYYKCCGLDDEEILKLIGDVSRHRHQHGQKTHSPPSMWDLSIPEVELPIEPATQRKRVNKYMRERKFS